jgi:hypothetical protein
MRPIDVYMTIKAASNDGMDPTHPDVLRPKIDAAKDYLTRNQGHMAHSAANNVLYGLLSNPRGVGPASILGSSTGGVLDGMLMRPVTDAGIELVGRGLRKFYGLGEKTASVDN